MTPSLRRLAFSLVLGSALVGGVALSAAPASAQSCDQSYPDFCLPYLGYNAYNCEDIPYRNFTVVGEDINYFDWDYDPQTGQHYKDGIGCETYYG